jgi:hypothetical protein
VPYNYDPDTMQLLLFGEQLNTLDRNETTIQRQSQVRPGIDDFIYLLYNALKRSILIDINFGSAPDLLTAPPIFSLPLSFSFPLPPLFQFLEFLREGAEGLPFGDKNFDLFGIIRIFIP